MFLQMFMIKKQLIGNYKTVNNLSKKLKEKYLENYNMFIVFYK